MTVSMQVRPLCDGRAGSGRCSTSIEFIENGSFVVSLARESAKARGWTHVECKDYCATCSVPENVRVAEGTADGA